jgi:hypothetical protein
MPRSAGCGPLGYSLATAQGPGQASAPIAWYQSVQRFSQSGQTEMRGSSVPAPQSDPPPTSDDNACRTSQPPLQIADYSKECSFERSQSQHHRPQQPLRHLKGANGMINASWRKMVPRQRLLCKLVFGVEFSYQNREIVSPDKGLQGSGLSHPRFGWLLQEGVAFLARV